MPSESVSIKEILIKLAEDLLKSLKEEETYTKLKKAYNKIVANEEGKK